MRSSGPIVVGTIVGLMAALGLGACAADDNHGPATAATVGVRASGCSLVDNFGTGVAIAADLVATSAHTIAGATAVTVIDQAGAENDAEIVAFDPRQDVAILQLDTAMSFAELGTIGKGDTGVLATWHPDRGFETTAATVTRLLRVTIEDIYIDELTERSAFEIEAEVVRGDSGGPVFAADGAIAGIVYAASRNRAGIGFVLRASEIAAALQQVDGRRVDRGRCP